MEEHNEDLQSIVSSEEQLLEIAEMDKESIKEEVESLEERYNALKNDVDEKLKEKSKSDNVVEEVWKIKARQAKLCDDIGRKLDLMEPVGSDVEKVRLQAEEIEVCLSGTFSEDFDFFTRDHPQVSSTWIVAVLTIH